METTSSIESCTPTRAPRNNEGTTGLRPDEKVRILTHLESLGFFRKGHFVGASGRHLDTYVDKTKISGNQRIQKIMETLLALTIRDLEFDVLVGPAEGGNVVSQLASDALYEMLAMPSSRVRMKKNKNGSMSVQRKEIPTVRGKKVLLLDDTATTGRSLQRAMRGVHKAGGEVVGIVVLINRDKKRVNSETMEVPFHSIFDLNLRSWPESRVPQWLQKIPVDTAYGHGKKYLESKNQIL